MLRSALTIVGGLVALFVVVLLGTLVATWLLAGAGGEVTPGYLAANLAVSWVAAAIGGALVVRYAPRRPLLHAGILGFCLLVLGLLGGFEPAAGQPAGYPLVVLLLGLCGIAVGAWWSWRAGRGRRTRELA
jgi:hypothetical protein